MPQVESHLSALKIHGGRTDSARLCFPTAPTPWIDLSTGINPLAYPTDALLRADPCALPSPARLALLEAAAATAFGMTAGSVAALPGSEIGLRLLGTFGLPGPVSIVAPSYATHRAAFPAATAIDLAALADADWTTALLANPNNPDGRMTPPQDLLAVARARAPSGGWLVIDEAFADATPGASVLPYLVESDRVVVLRSFGKFYGLAGVRLGFACGPEEIVARFRSTLGSWPVSSAAIEIGLAAYRDSAWQEATRAVLTRAAARLDSVLRRHGLHPRGACPLFRLVETPAAAVLFERLAGAGILTRPFDYAPHWLRVGLPQDLAALDRLDQALGHS